MIHHRQKMRERVVSLLKAADIKGINDRVFATIFHASRELPLISVWIEGETVVPESGEYNRTVQIVVTILAKAPADVENDMDSYCAQIEASIDQLLGGLALNGWLSQVRFERKGDPEKGDQEYISCDLVYAFLYVTSYYNPTLSTH